MLPNLKLPKFTYDNALVPLKNYCKENELTLLFASDCGSHAWGYASDTSDWDIKFLYMHDDPDKYLSLFEPMQHTSFKYKDVVEYAGYDVRKYLGLLLKGNANTHEMVNSQYFYASAGDTARDLADFTHDVLSENLDKVLAHYTGLAGSTYNERIRNVGEVTLKKWIYVVRPLLCAQFIHDKQALPPLNFAELLAWAPVPNDVRSLMTELLEDRRQGRDSTNLDMKPVDDWATERLNHWFQYLKDLKENGILQERLLTYPENFDKVYREILKGTFSFGE